MKIAVLALQGAFIEHEKKLEQLGATCIELRQKSDLDQDFDGRVLPGGESTVQGKLLKELDMFDDLQKRIQDGLPTLATCAGLILLAKEIENKNQIILIDSAIGRKEDIGNTYVRKDTYSKDLKALTKESESQSKRIDAINKLMWFLISAVLAFVIAGLLESTFLVR